jgi:hypothetical protein
MAGTGMSSVAPVVRPYHRGRRGPLRSSRLRASLTVNGRPPNDVPFSPAIAAWASELFGISTKPKPRGRPVSRSVIIRTVSTVPYASKQVRSSWSVVVKAGSVPQLP